MVKHKRYQASKGDDNLSLREKILEYLIENKEKAKTIREISKYLNVDYKNTFQAIKKIYPSLISKDKIGSSNLVKIKLIPSHEIFSIEHKRTTRFLERNKPLKLMQDDINSADYPFLIILIFGSYAKETKTKKSDIDLCIICDNEAKKKELISKLSLLPLKLEIHDFKVSEFESMLEVKKENIAKEIIKNNIIIYGIENYYNLISKWTEKE
jgi:predicted nucleotidyltransferase